MPLAKHLSIASMLALAEAEYQRSNAAIVEYRCALEIGNWEQAETLRLKALHHFGECLDQFAMAYREMSKL